jgi:hypothetical protein
MAQGVIMSRGPFLRSCLLFSLFLSSSPIFAQTTPVSIEDPSYLPDEGHLISDTGFSYEREKYQGYSQYFYGGALIASDKYSNENYTVSQGLQYGLLPGLVVGLGISCSYRGEADEQYDFGFTSKDHKTGCNDPYVQAIYRGLRQSDQLDFPVNIDLAASYSPNLFKATYGQINTAPGSSSGDVNLAVSHVFQDFTLLGRLGVALQDRVKSRYDYVDQYQGIHYTDELSAVAQPYLQLVSQYRPVDDLFLTGGVTYYAGYRQSENTDYDYTETFGFPYDSSRATAIKISQSVTPFIGASWTLIPETLSASIRYQHGFLGKVRYAYSDGSGEWEDANRSNDFVGIDLRVLWF